MFSDAQPPLSIVNHMVLEQRANHLIYDPLRDQFIVTIPSSDVEAGNSLGFLDPADGEFTGLHFVGSEPDPLALTDDGAYVYVGVNGAAVLKRFNMTTNQVDMLLDMGYAAPSAPLMAGSIDCQPGTNSVVAVSKFGAGTEFPFETSVYDDGVERELSVSSGYECNFIRFKEGTPGRLLGVDNSTGLYRLRTFSVSPEGVHILNSQQGLFDGDGSEFATYGNTIIVDDGTALDVSGEVPTLIGSYTIPEQVYFPRVCVDPYQDLICIAYRNVWQANDTLHIMRFNASTFLAQDKISIPGVLTGNTVKVVDFVCWGDSTSLALNMSNGRIVIIDGEVSPTTLPEKGTDAVPTIRIDPSSQFVSVVHTGPLTMRMVDSIGRQTRSADRTHELFIGDLVAGLYILQLFDPSSGRQWCNRITLAR